LSILAENSTQHSVTIKESVMPRTVSLSFELLETLVVLIRVGGEASVAMKELGINQPSLSKRLKYLQHAGPLLDRPWLVRKGKTWELTDEGRRVWQAVAELVDRYDNLETFLHGDRSPASSLRFSCGQLMAAGLVRDALRLIHREHPQTMLRISTLRGQSRIEGVSNGSLDLAIVSHDEASILEIARRPLHVEPLVSHGLALICAQSAPWIRVVRGLPKDAVQVGALAEFPLIVPEPDAGIRQVIDEALRREGRSNSVNIVLELGGWSTILAYVRDGFGVGVVSEAAVRETKGLAIRLLDPEVFPRVESKLICRRLAGSVDALDLPNQGMAWREVLRRVARRS
jgi:LysR family transcriptional regulator, benzoate and cis,cis-muconate-responsive activator of ben and cat genes